MTTRATGSILLLRQALDVVQLGELAAVVGRRVLLELLQRLAPEVGAVDQEQHALHAAELDHAVDGGDRRPRLAAAGRHLDQRSRPVVGQRLLQVADRPRLHVPQVRVMERRHRPQRRAQRSSAGRRLVVRQRGASAERRAPIQPANVSGRWKLNSGRLRGSGSSWLVNRVSTPVLS